VLERKFLAVFREAFKKTVLFIFIFLQNSTRFYIDFDYLKKVKKILKRQNFGEKVRRIVKFLLPV
jgi:hypothetical protein